MLATDATDTFGIGRKMSCNNAPLADAPSQLRNSL